MLGICCLWQHVGFTRYSVLLGRSCACSITTNSQQSTLTNSRVAGANFPSHISGSSALVLPFLAPPSCR